jgi:glycosyltransferase involved in cell wall biosynthesis
LAPSEIVKNVRVHRVATTQFGRSALPGRALDYLSFYLAMRRAVLGLARRGDILVAKTDPPLLSLPIMRIASRRGINLVNWLQDLFPEVAIELGIAVAGGRAGRALAAARDASLRAARANVVLGYRMAERVRARGVPENRIHIIHNWSDDETIRPVPAQQNPLRQEWGLTRRFVIGYSGNLGRAHEYDTMLKAAERLRHRDDIFFLFIGTGHQLDALKHSVTARALDHMFRFMSYQARNALTYSLGVPDIHWVSLRPELEGLIVPSKFYGIAAAGRPVIAISASDGEIARLVAQHRCGLVIEPGDADGLAAALVSLAADSARVNAMGAAARAMLDKHFTRRHAFDRWRILLEKVSIESE